MNHSFIIPAYGRSPFLEGCIESLMAQTAKSPIVISTSTPFDGLDALGYKFGVRLHIHSPNRGIGPDWNAALDVADTQLVTLAHQDDIYLPEFSERMVAAAHDKPQSTLLFSDADEIDSRGELIPQHHNTTIKRLMVGMAFAGRTTIQGAVSRRLLFGLGNPVICPAVTINRTNTADFRFREDLRTNMDWLAWIELAERGAVTRVAKVLMQHRAHEQSETARCLADGARQQEDRMIFERMWPRPVSDILSRLYQRSYAGYSE